MCLFKKEFSRKDLRKTANWINAFYKKSNPEDPPKKEQVEGDKTFMVFCYPDEFIPEMDRIVKQYFFNKDIRAERHLEYLDAIKNNIEIPKDEKKDKDAKPKFQSKDGKFSNNKNFKKPFNKDGKKPFNKFDSNKNFKPRESGNDANKESRPFTPNRENKPKSTVPTAPVLRKRKTPPGAAL